MEPISRERAGEAGFTGAGAGAGVLDELEMESDAGVLDELETEVDVGVLDVSTVVLDVPTAVLDVLTVVLNVFSVVLDPLATVFDSLAGVAGSVLAAGSVLVVLTVLELRPAIHLDARLESIASTPGGGVALSVPGGLNPDKKLR
mmetsp:Transcript_49503/g.124469  ORF Transcript_49503/g.124469 Transcript_49503/m.124469 type:complete len:145 (+) Transcript_49503:642-1076(+)